VLGRVRKVIQADGQYTETTRTLTTTTIRDEAARLTVATEGPFGLTQLTDADGKTWVYSYNESGQLLEIAGPVGDPLQPSVSRTWEYNTDHRVDAETTPESGRVTYDSYNAAGQVEQKTDANGTVFTYAYDGNHRLHTVTAVHGEETVTSTTDFETGTDRVASITTEGVQTTFGYEPGTGRLTSRTENIDGKVFTTAFAYDANDNVASIAYASGREVRYEYDQHGRAKRVYNLATGQNYANQFTYHGSGALSGFTAGNGIATAFTFDPVRYSLYTIDAGTLLQLTYHYDDAGNVLQLDDRRANRSQYFNYDNLDRLARAWDPTPTLGWDIHYAFDAHGNRQAAPSGGQSYEYYGDNPFRLWRINGVGNYAYDANGNLKTGNIAGTGAFTYTYRPDNLMRQATVGATTTQFGYDAGGVRTTRSKDGVTVYSVHAPDGRLLTEWTNTSPTTATAVDYIYAGDRMIGASTRTNLEPR
jgi:YD repeat-containing protein